MPGEELLQDDDREFLARKAWDYEVKPISHPDGQELLIIVHNFAMPEKYQPETVDLLVRQPPKYPEVGMDMFWTRPTVTFRDNGQRPQATEAEETHDNLLWQRWSRHHTGWRPNKDNLETFFGAVLNELSK